MPKDEPEGKKTSVNEEGIFTETPGEKESIPCGRRSGQLREYKEDIRIGRKKIRKAKA